VSAAPTGHVTLLFTDIEGSTRLARELAGGWAAVLTDHHAILEREIAARHGHVEGTAGDSFLAIFADPRDAVSAAVAIQRALGAHSWPGGVGELRVRMGLHSGVVDRRGDGFVGLDIHLAARVQGVAHGGQIVVTEPTRRLVAGEFELVPLGEHRLKDFPEPERLFQVVVDGRGPDAFPPLRSAPVRPTNLPVELRPLVGRGAELRALREAVLGDDRRLHTITGLGGTGKTRLALAAARELLDEHPGGVWLVPLAGVREPAALLPAVAATLGVRDDVGRPLSEAIAARIGDTPTLLLLDNFEQLVAAASAVGALLDDAPGVRVIVTSQLPLRLERERVHRLDALERTPAVELFAERATTVLDDFDIETERPDVEQIVERVGGMPLAIELAAARIAVLTPAQLLTRLDRTLGTPVRGASQLEERHRSLRATLEWTHGLLGDTEQVLMARLAAFSGPAPLDAIDAVAGASGVEPVDAAEALVGLLAASVVRRQQDRTYGVRFAMAQTVRDFAADKLAGSGEDEAVRAAHAAYVAGLAEACRFWFPGHSDESRARVSALVEEQRPALSWTRERDAVLHLRLASALGAIMYRSGRLREAEFELAHALGRLPIAGQTAGWAAVVLSAVLGVFGRPQEARALAEAAEPALRDGEDDALLDHGLRGLGVVWFRLEEPVRAAAAAGESVAIARTRGDVTGLAAALGYQAWALVEAGRLEAARAAIVELEQLLPNASDSTLAGLLVSVHADWAMANEDWPAAARGYARHAHASQVIRDDGQTFWDVMGMTIAYAALGDHERVLECEGLLTALTTATGMRHGPQPGWDRRIAEGCAVARRALSPAAADAAVARGAERTREERLEWLGEQVGPGSERAVRLR
jgi:predicted ATPase/class 3 adenylate cyclase